MKQIYIQQDGQKIGPFSMDKLRESIYSGQVSRSTLACAEGESEWLPVETVLSREEQPPPASAAPPVLDADLKRLRDPRENTALVLLYVASVPVWLLLVVWCFMSFGIPLIFIGIIWLFVVFGELWFAAHLKTNAVRVSPTQLPEVFRVVQSCCDRLGMECPEVYVMQHNIWNAFATKIFRHRMVVLFSGAVDSILLKGDLQQLTWLVGHELGHHWAGHLNVSQKLAKAGGWLIWVNLWHSRRSELTCDRVGMYCAGSLKASQLALVNATVGAQLAAKVNVGEAAMQWQMHSREFFVRYRTLYATHPHLLARLDCLSGAATELGIAN